MVINESIKMSKEVKDCIENCFKSNMYFHFFSIVAVVLLVTSFFIPPVSLIDSSVFIAVSELFGFAALGTVIKAIDKGVDAKVQHRDTSVTIGDLSKQEKIEEDGEIL